MAKNSNDIFSIKSVTRKFHVATTKGKKCTKNCAARAKFFLWLIRPIVLCCSHCRRRLALHNLFFV